MTREEVIDYIATYLWNSGIGGKGGGRNAAEVIVHQLIKAGVIVVLDDEAKKVRTMRAVQGW